MHVPFSRYSAGGSCRYLMNPLTSHQAFDISVYISADKAARVRAMRVMLLSAESSIYR